MTTFDWTTAIAECCTHLAGLGNLPAPAAQNPALQIIAVVSLIAGTPIQHALTPDSTIPVLTISSATILPGSIDRSTFRAAPRGRPKRQTSATPPILS